MLQKIKGNYNVRQQVKAFIKEADRMVNAYGWQNRVTYPYSYPMKITGIIEELKDYDSYTAGSKAHLISLANGLADILNAWEEHHVL
ncbi:hypothetical protein [uncultured Methanobrevibacter sp.]|uniref:hypothetical protein n=1 Tax=uncultured Methanobrevibacter sp. TaxID=253161 RepID=UPI00261038CA|nr:hypothetical protein [uncultured Methanobrevibacter sp.]